MVGVTQTLRSRRDVVVSGRDAQRVVADDDDPTGHPISAHKIPLRARAYALHCSPTVTRDSPGAISRSVSDGDESNRCAECLKRVPEVVWVGGDEGD